MIRRRMRRQAPMKNLGFFRVPNVEKGHEWLFHGQRAGQRGGSDAPRFPAPGKTQGTTDRSGKWPGPKGQAMLRRGGMQADVDGGSVTSGMAPPGGERIAETSRRGPIDPTGCVVCGDCDGA